MLDKKSLSERDICTKYISPAIEKAGWDKNRYLEQVYFTDGKIYVKGRMTTRGKRKFADYILYYLKNIPIAIIEAKDNNHSIRSGIQQGLDYAKILDIPCVFSSNGDGFLFHDRTISDGNIETELTMEQFPTPEQLWEKYKKFKGIEEPVAEKIVLNDYHFDYRGKTPRYYQQIAINRSVEAIAKGQDRVLLVMATGTGKTYTAFQIAWRLWKSGAKKRILFLADRTALIDQTRRNDFKYFKENMTIIKKKVVSTGEGKDYLESNKKRGIDSSDKAYEVFLGLYQGLSNSDPEIKDAYKDFSEDFFDLIIVDECHRGSAKEDSVWREILNYFKSATHIGMTATPKETKVVSNIEYFGEPVYTYSLKQGIDDGFLAPYRVIRVGLNVDLEGWRPEKGKLDKDGDLVEDRNYNRVDYDRNLVIDERTQTVAKKITEFLKGYDRYAKTIVFCADIDHAERMRTALSNLNSDLVSKNSKYIMQITGDNQEGKNELDNFTDPEEKYPVIATTSELMTTGVDAQTCKLIVLDCVINSQTKFKQIIGRGTRVREDYDKRYFTILDFKNATDQFADPNFDGDPIRIKPLTEGDDLSTIIDDEELSSEPIIDEVTGEEIKMEPKIVFPEIENYDNEIKETKNKVYVNGVDVSVLVSREIYFDENGKPITMSLIDHTKLKIKGSFASLNDFINRWNEADKKEVIIHELEGQGIFINELLDSVKSEVDVFDLICHVAYDQPPLTRKERAENVRKRNYFTKYGEKARKVLDALLDKYADEGIENIENIDILKVKPLTEFGSPVEIVNGIFGSKSKYISAIKELEKELYKTA
ncbi:MAG: DEAD/DEAH box helicase family protein [Candidatus Delongbacteria bacterium]|nr:DEAD/DEAH box helicase family protein [Candidatus Delongbacteria bacterium]MCG2760746.1 DEAD/DEAH box helicase family protein [Candidatus Delongbacteria bacterium]